MAVCVHPSGKHGRGVAVDGGGWVQGEQERGSVRGQAGVGNQPVWLAAGAVKRPMFSQAKIPSGPQKATNRSLAGPERED